MLLHDRLKNYRLILASQSPRRRELMAQAGFEVEIAPKFDCEEVYPPTLPAGEVSQYLSVLKSAAYPSPLTAREILITADTTVIAGDKVLGKPSSREDARQMLHTLSARRHDVVSGVTLRTATAERSFSTVTGVWFKALSDEEIAYYIDTFRPYDKAGAYGIQEWIGCAAVERIDGSYFNVMGLPIQRLYTELEHLIDDNK